LIISAWLLVSIIIIVILIVVLVAFLTVRTYRYKVAAGREDLVGRTAVVEIALDPKGVVLVEGEHWTATLDKGRAEPEEEVIITKVDGLRLFVTRKE
jgi:membrane protein implicated in regulation of membrane protease activity